MKNVQLPTFISAHDFMKEVQHVDGFAPEIFVVNTNQFKLIDNHFQQKPNNSNNLNNKNNTFNDLLVVRSTSEVIFCECFKKILNSYNDLPILYNQ